MKLSVIIPCRNEEKHIEECVHAVFQNRLPSNIDMKVFIVDGMSDDGTRNIIEKLIYQYDNLELIDNTVKLTPYTFNLGIKKEQADFYQIVGARQILSPNYLETSIAKLNENKDIWCVGGYVNNVYLNDIGEIISKAMSTSFGMGFGNFRTFSDSTFTDTVGTPMYPAFVFDKIGYFDEELVRNQDDDFNFRVLKAGGKIWFDHSISLKYYVRGSYKNMVRQFFQYGYWKVYVNKKHKTVTTLRQIVPLFFVLFLILAPVTFLLHELIWIGTIIVLAFYMVLALFSTFKLRVKLKEIMRIAITYPLMHTSYGWGYLTGVVHFLIFSQKPSSKHKRLSR